VETFDGASRLPRTRPNDFLVGARRVDRAVVRDAGMDYFLEESRMEFGWKMFLYGVMAANQVWLAILFIVVVPKLQKLRELEKK
jgi:hypothetical protein